MTRRMNSLLKLAHVPLSLIISQTLMGWWQVHAWFPLWLLLGGLLPDKLTLGCLSQGLPMTPPKQRLSGVRE